LFQTLLKFAQGFLLDTGYVGTRNAEALCHLALRFAAAAAQPVPEADDDLFPTFKNGPYQAIKLFDSLCQINLFLHFFIFTTQDIDEGNLIALNMMYIC